MVDQTQPGWGLWGRWVLANAIAEGIGLGGSLVIGGLLFSGMASSSGVWPTLGMALLAVLLGTFFEGVVVGIAQGWVLRHPLPNLRLWTWVVATSAGACVAWLLGMLPSTIMSLMADAAASTATSAPVPEISDTVMYGLAAAMGLVLGPILALPQWVVLRRHVSRAGWWVLANALAWMCALPLTFIWPGFVSPEGVDGTLILVIIGTVIAAGAVVGMIHGAALVWLLRDSYQK